MRNPYIQILFIGMLSTACCTPKPSESVPVATSGANSRFELAVKAAKSDVGAQTKYVAGLVAAIKFMEQQIKDCKADLEDRVLRSVTRIDIPVQASLCRDLEDNLADQYEELVAETKVLEQAIAAYGRLMGQASHKP